MIVPLGCHTHDPTRQSDAIWLVKLLVRRAVSCPCHQSPSIGVLQGAGQDSRDRARLLHDYVRTSRHDMKVVIDEAGQGDPLDSSGQVHRCVTVDVSSSYADVASLGFRWEPLESERGRLVACAADLDVTLDSGMGLTVYACDEALVVETIEDCGAITRLSTTPGAVDIYDRDASHRLLRDEHLIGDAPAHARLFLDSRGRVRRSE